ncbi:MAG: hypothetical protein AB7F75_08675 [Planctomycetota bacterium]
MAKPNYAFAKRQRDLAKKAKQEEKRQKKLAEHSKAPEVPPAAPTSEPLPPA